ncbi:uncharacterized protein LOC144630951 [Oculina patagonica]
MEPFVPATMGNTFFLADSGYIGQPCNRNIWESTRINPATVPWQVYQNIPSSSQCTCEVPNCNMHHPEFHRTARGSPPMDSFYYNYEPAMFPYVSSSTSMEHPLQSNRAENENKKKLTCEICKKMFLRPSALKVHMRIHNGEKPFKCTQCPQAFSQSGNLTVHLRMHTGEKPFVCGICLKRFSQSNSLRVHLRRHTGEKPYQCRECNKCFADRSTLVKHRRVHMNDGIGNH